MGIVFSREKRKESFLLLIYKIVMEVIYQYVAHPLYDYAGLTLNINIQKAVISYLLFFTLISLPSYKVECVSKYLLRIFLLFTIIPLLCIYWQTDRSTSYVLMACLSYMIIYFLCQTKNEKPVYLLSMSGLGKINILFVLLIINVVCLLTFTAVYGLADFRALVMDNIYTLRAEREYTGIWAYVNKWMTYSFVPCMLCIALKKKRSIYVVAAILIQFYMFLHTGMKSTLFSIGLILYSYYLVQKRKNYSNWWTAALIGLSIMSTLFYKLTTKLTLISVFPVRLTNLPAIISFNHYDFFSNNPKLYFSEIFIGRLFGIKSPYDTFSTFLVSQSGGNANTGYIADAYDNAGFLCIIAYSVILAFILRYIDRLQRRSGEDALPVYVGIMTYIMLFLNDGSLTSSLVTGGLFITMFILSRYKELVTPETMIQELIIYDR